MHYVEITREAWQKVFLLVSVKGVKGVGNLVTRDSTEKLDVGENNHLRGMS